MLTISDVNPYIRKAIHSVIRATHVIKRRIIFDYELLYVADGEFILNYNETDYRCQKGQFVFLRPGVPHSFQVGDHNLTQPHIHFDVTHQSDSASVPISFKDIPDMTEHEKRYLRKDAFAPYPQEPLVHFADKQRALALFYEIVDPSDISPLTRKAKLILLLEMLIRDNFQGVFEQEIVPYRMEQQVKDYIDAGQGLTANLDDLANQFNYSKYYLERRFQEQYGMGLIAYRNYKRMQLAKTMLQTKTVSEVATALGFSSIFVFSRAFKNHFGSSPTNAKTAE